MDLASIRAQFPTLEQEIHGKPLVYLDSGATALKPQAVIDAIVEYYRDYPANVHRGAHQLSGRATDAFEAGREKVASFIGAASDREVILTAGTTESLNLVAQAYLRPRISEGDEILVTAMEHHSNLVPWHLVAEQTGATVKAVPFDDDGALLVDQTEALLTDRTKLVAVTHVSNTLGTVNPISRIAELAHARGAVVAVDGAQAAPHMAIDMAELGADFYAFSGHKCYGPTGVGVLWGRGELLAAMPPYQGGGGMIRQVFVDRTTYAEPPGRFEAGTPNIAGVIGLRAALAWMERVGLDAIAAHEAELVKYAHARLAEVPGLTIWGRAEGKAAVVQFTMEGAHAADIATIVDRSGVAIRAGHHCAQPVMDHFGVPATARASFGVYNTLEDVDRLVEALQLVSELFAQ